MISMSKKIPFCDTDEPPKLDNDREQIIRRVIPRNLFLRYHHK